VKSLKSAKEHGAAKEKEKFIEAVNQALLYGGIMSHFVGDLAEPHHTSANYDGWLTGQGGPSPVL